MTTANKTRLWAVAVVAIVIPLGLLARSHRAGADPATLAGFFATYTGDTLWPIMFYFAGRFCFPNAKLVSLVMCVVALTLTLEFSQLWKPPWLMSLRAMPGIGFVLGNHFIWSDVACCLVGSGLAMLVDLIRRSVLSHSVDSK